ncbi:MAG: sugar phosphate isomerase/epimerase family protein, partial [Planctomycetota bacterium]
MQLGIHVGTFHRPTLEATLEAVQEHGLECVHFNMAAAGLPSMPERIEEEVCDRIAGELAARGISMATLSGTFNMIHPSVDVRRAGLRRLEAVASRARRMGTSLLTLCTGTRDPDDMWRHHPDNYTSAAWADLVDSIGVALQIAERHSVTLGVEPEVS